jgi:hypothetical protein
MIHGKLAKLTECMDKNSPGRNSGASPEHRLISGTPHAE